MATKRRYLTINCLLSYLVANKDYKDVDHCATIVSRYFCMDSFEAYEATHRFFTLAFK